MHARLFLHVTLLNFSQSGLQGMHHYLHFTDQGTEA